MRTGVASRGWNAPSWLSEIWSKRKLRLEGPARWHGSSRQPVRPFHWDIGSGLRETKLELHSRPPKTRLIRTRRFDVELMFSAHSPVVFFTRDPVIKDLFTHGHWPIGKFKPVRVSVDAAVSIDTFRDQMREVALDVINQGGIMEVQSVL